MYKRNEDFSDDFGFSTVDKEDILDYNQQKVVDKLSDEKAELQRRLDTMYDTISKLLINLSKNPQQELIKWPNRMERIAEFRAKLGRIHTGEE